MRNREYKPLMFTTTVRNPERYKALIGILLRFGGQVLTNELIDKIIFEMVARKEYVPVYAKRTARLSEQLVYENERFSDDDTREIVGNSPQNHKEAGFDKGWPSRFDTFYKFAMELGLVWYEIGKPLEVSETGVKLAQSAEEGFEHLEQQVFLNAFVKYRRDNPFRRVKNANKPLVLLLRVIDELRKIYGGGSAGISRREIPLVLCWQDCDAVKLAAEIKGIRDRYGFTASDEVIYDICKGLLGITEKGEKRFKTSNIFGELPDEFLRKMRLTGLITLRGNGRFIDFNSLEDDKIRYILERYDQMPAEFVSARECYDFMRTVDANLLSIEARTITAETDKERFLSGWAAKFEPATLKDELKIVCSRQASTKNAVLKFIDRPTRFEFLTAMALKRAFPSLRVVPNYKVDDEGLPIAWAQGGGADIVCHDEAGSILFEVTLLTGTQQNIRETPSIARHLRETVKKAPDSFSVMLCPRAHDDTLRYARFVKYDEGLDVTVLETSAFVDTLGERGNARRYRRGGKTRYSGARPLRSCLIMLSINTP